MGGLSGTHGRVKKCIQHCTKFERKKRTGRHMNRREGNIKLVIKYIQKVRIWAGTMWLGILTSSGHLWTRK